MKFDFDKKPGKLLNTKEYEEVVPIISIIFPIINNDKMNINSINSILNQTYPNFELIIIGNYNEYKLNDKRIKLIDKVYDNIFDAYNYGEKNVNQESKYLVFFKEGDLMETTYLETTYWSLITHSKASWAYSNAVVYGEKSIENKLFDEYYSPQKLNSNLLFMIRREAFEEINGFQSNADYAVGFSIFWKNLIKKGMAPVHSTWYLNWMSYQNYNSYYNVKKHINVEYEESRNKGVQFPFFKYNYEEIDFENENLVKVKQKKNNKINILMIVPWIIIGGADIFNLELIKRLDKNKYTFTLISTEPAINNLRQKIENIADVYDITSFIECKDYISFIKYIMEKNNINMIFNTSSFFGYSILPYLKGMYPQIPIVDYIHMEEWYNRNGGYARSSSMLEGIIDKTLVCNSVTEEILVNYFKRKDNEVETVYIGVDTE